MCGEKEEAHCLLYETASSEAGDISKILSLFYKNNDLSISLSMSENYWVSH